MPQLASRAHAQITFIPGPQIAVPQSPQFIATADFNRDGIADVAATDRTSGIVSVLLGTGDGSLRLATSFSVGHELRGIAAGDLNCDGSPDIAVVDSFDNRLLVVTGNGDGSFNRPASYLTGDRPVDIAIGNFDTSACAGLAVLNQASGTVSVFRSVNGDPGFAAREFEMGPVPRRLTTADLDGDGLDDIVAITQGAADDSTSAISIVINRRDGTFGAPTTFATAPRAIGLTVADLNGDGARDLIVLHAATRLDLAPTLSLLLQQTGDAGRQPSSPTFAAAQGVLLSCPQTIRGVPVSCSPTSITTADYDEDGFLDLVVAFVTYRSDGNVGDTPGVLSAFGGLGDASFSFETQVLVGANPARIASADLTGDGMPDIATAEEGTRAVRITRSVVLPPPHGHGCFSDTQCLSGFCVEGVCCNAHCPAGQFCNIPGSYGTCSVPGPNGAACFDAQQCASAHCVDGVCCDTTACSDPQRCDIFGFKGSCTTPQPLSSPCEKDSDCASGLVCRLLPDAMSFLCLPPLPVPTEYVPSPRATDAGPGASISQASGDGDGCAVNSRHDSSLGLVLLLPALLLLASRNRSQRGRLEHRSSSHRPIGRPVVR